MKRIRIATYNIWHGGPQGVYASAIGQMIKDHSIDIIGLQEVDRGCIRSNHLDILESIALESGLKHYQFFKAMNYQEGEYGLGVISRFPMINVLSYPLTHSIEPRICSRVDVDIEGLILPFFNTHFELGTYLATRKHQFAQVQSLLEKTERFVLVGDFNVADWRMGEIYEYEAYFGQYRLANNKNQIFATYRKNRMNLDGEKPIDNIITSFNIDMGMPYLVEKVYSDHHMMVVDIII